MKTRRITKKIIDKNLLLTELDFLRKHYDRLAELMGVKGTKWDDYRIEHQGKVKFIDYLILRIKDKDFDLK